jgi:nucleotide-binding universal stress UspA family protein
MHPQGFRHILSPVDFSDTSALGLRLAASLARCSDAQLTAVYADQFLPPPYFTQNRLEEITRQLQDAERQAEQRLTEFVAEYAAGVAVETKVVRALPVEGILAAAAEAGADLIAMGTHGRSGFNRWMLGSVTERVLRASHVPILTVHPRAATVPHFPQLRGILCPVNNTEVSRRALEIAARMAQCFQARLTVLHVQEKDGEGAIADLCAWIPEELRSHCSLREETMPGEAAHAIIHRAGSSDCDLLVLGARRRKFFDSSVIGATSVRVVRHAPCPVLTVTG